MSDPYQTAGDIRRALASISDHYDVALHPPKRGGGNGGGNASKEPPPPVSVDVLDVRRDTHRDLVHYTQVVLLECTSADGQQIATHVDAGDVYGLLRFLDVWAQHLAEGNAIEAEACARELGEHAAKLRGMALPDRRDWMPLGTCPIEVEIDGALGPCGGQVRRYEGRDPYCMRCGTEADASWWERQIFPEVLSAELADLVTADQLVTLLRRAFGGAPIKAATLRVWDHRGIIERAGTTPDGHALYSRRAVIQALSSRVC